MLTDKDVMEFFDDIESPEADLWPDRLCMAFKLFNDTERFVEVFRRLNVLENRRFCGWY